jgi:phenylacetate-CoA ligase
VTTVQTSGSTGQPVAVRRTAVNLTFWSALNMRDHFWHRRDFKRTLAIIRARVAAHPSDEGFTSDWGEPANLLFETGRCHQLPLDTDVAAQVEWLRRHDPDYLLTYPTNLSALLDRFESSGTRLPNLTEVRTVGETLREGLRERCSQLLGARVVDGYSSQEVGAIALQCDQSLLYHLHSESLMVEVLDAEGRAVRPGETGRVVVTDLHNFATPLIRYDLRDHAEVGAPCPCGRGLPTLSRILGRQRNMVVLPNGARYWPLVGYHRYREVAGVVQYQLIQHSLDEIEMRLVVAGSPLSGSQEERLASVVRESLRHPFRIRFTYFDRELPRTRTGKFEEFVCHVA